FREGCDAYSLRVGPFAYHRSYAYIGVTSSLMYYPLWPVWHSHASFYLLWIVCLLAFSFGLTRALRVPARCALIPLCYFPIAYLTIQELGPIRLALLSMPALALIAARALAAPTRARQLGYAVLAS